MKTSNKILLGLFGLVAISIVCSAFVARSAISNAETIAGSGNVISEDRQIDSFDEIKVNGNFEVHLVPGTESLRIEADDNLLSSIISENRGDDLIIRSAKGKRIKQNVVLYIGFDDLKNINTSGSARITSEQKLVLPDLKIRTSGYGYVELDIETEKLSARISGSGEMNLSGSADYAEYKISGSGTHRSFNLASQKVEVSISGSGLAEVNAAENLEASISGSGRIEYKGQPRLSQSISGAGKIVDMNE